MTNTMSKEETVGAVLLGFGIASFILSTWGPSMTGGDAGDYAAIGMFLVMMGMVFYFPTLLKDYSGQTSTMRVVVFMVAAVFVILTVKTGWKAASIKDLEITESWRWVLASVLGGKVLQSYVELAVGMKAGDRRQ